MLKLTWADLFTEEPLLDVGRLLRLWPRTVGDVLRPIGMSAFGDIYFERPRGQVERLDVLEGGVHYVAWHREEFAIFMNTQSWQEENLLAEGIYLLKERGLTRSPQQCFAFAPHPVFTGKLDWNRVMVMDAYPWHSICSQLFEGQAAVEDAT